MSKIDIIIIFIFFFCLMATTVTGRKQWLWICFWSIPAWCVLSVKSVNLTLNGLILIICFVMVFQVIYSLWGVKLWCIQARKIKKPIYISVLFINFFLSYYCFYESTALMDFYKTFHNSKLIALFSSFVIAVLAAKFMQNTSITVLDLYFSKKEEFPLIHCSTVVKVKRGKNEKQKKYIVKGIQNGITYNFNMTKKAFLLLKPQKSFVFKVKHGYFGGVYVIGDVYKYESKRRIRRINRLLIKEAVFILLTAVLFLLLVIRIRTGIGFEDIFALIGRGVGIE